MSDFIESENLHLQGKASDHIWLMEDGEEPHVIGIRMDCGDAGTVYLTRKQALQLAEQITKFATHPPSAERPNLSDCSETARTLVRKLIEVANKYHSGHRHKNWEIWAVNEIANALAAEVQPERPNLGELREQLVKWLHAKRQIWEQNKADDAETCMDCCNEIDIDILPIIEQRERDLLAQVMFILDNELEGYWTGNETDHPHEVCFPEPNFNNAIEKISKLKSQPKEGGK